MRLRFILIALLTAFWTSPAGSAPTSAASLEYAVKAVYLTKFVPFITWPDNVFASPASPVTICVLGRDPFGGKLDQAAAAKAGPRPLAVRYLSDYDPAASCQLLFLGQDADAPSVLAATAKRPILTVTDSGLEAHGIISFVIDANHVRVDIDDAAAQNAGITISSKLLSLARHVARKDGT
jgi:hypothetical protein